MDDSFHELKKQLEYLSKKVEEVEFNSLRTINKSYFENPNKTYKIAGDLILPKMEGAGALFVDRNSKIRKINSIITLRATSGMIEIEVPSDVHYAEIECIGGGGGGGASGRYGSNSSGTSVGIPGGGGGGSAGQRQVIFTQVFGTLKCYVGQGGFKGSLGEFPNSSISYPGTGGGGGGNGGITAVLNEDNVLLCLAVGGTGGGGGGGGSGLDSNSSSLQGATGGSSSSNGSGSTDENSITYSGGLGGSNGWSYTLPSNTLPNYINSITLGGVGGSGINDEHGHGGNGGDAKYPNSGTGGGGYGYSGSGNNGQGISTYQVGEDPVPPAGGRGGPKIGSISSSYPVEGKKGGAGGCVHFYENNEAPGRGGDGGGLNEDGSNGNDGLIIIRFSNPINVA